ncbi:MAG TPA: hypothetical protein VK533_11360, partial [Sphingomonas sp.]|uniref:hypothetical protein n=1 Tax=Sphingomonas sp. TaxID=28214 RepID=UPI002BF041E7
MLARKAAHESVEIPIEDGIDEVSLALQAEAWGRSGRSKVAATHTGGRPVRSRHGLIIMADGEAQAGSYIIQPTTLPAVPQFEATLAEMERRYGVGAGRLVKVAMEYDTPLRAD